MDEESLDMKYVSLKHFDQNRPKVLQINNGLKLMSICFLVVKSDMYHLSFKCIGNKYSMSTVFQVLPRSLENSLSLTQVKWSIVRDFEF